MNANKIIIIIFLQLLSGLSALKNLPIKSDGIPVTEMTKPAAVVFDSEGNPIDQTTGRSITIAKRMPTLKVFLLMLFQ